MSSSRDIHALTSASMSRNVRLSFTAVWAQSAQLWRPSGRDTTVPAIEAPHMSQGEFIARRCRTQGAWRSAWRDPLGHGRAGGE